RRTDAGARLAGSRVRRRCLCPTLPADAAGQAADRESGPGLGGCPAPGQRAAGGRGDCPARQSRQEIEDAAGEVLATFFLGDIVVYANERAKHNTGRSPRFKGGIMPHALSTRSAYSVRSLTVSVLVAWFLLALGGSLLGVFDSEPRPPIPLGLAA